MTDEALWAVIAETYTVHFMLFGCGLSNEEVFVGIDPVEGTPEPGPYVYVVAKRNGADFVFYIAPLGDEDDQAAFRRAWRSFSERQPKMSRGELDWMVVTSEAYRQLPVLRDHLIKKAMIAPDAGLTLLAAWNAGFAAPSLEVN